MKRAWLRAGEMGLALAFVCAPASSQHEAPHGGGASFHARSMPREQRGRSAAPSSGNSMSFQGRVHPAMPYGGSDVRQTPGWGGQGSAHPNMSLGMGPGATVRPALPGYVPSYGGQTYGGAQAYGERQTPRSENAPVHLGAWLDQHRNLPMAEQERQLRSDPSFSRLSPNVQQRLVQQLHQVNGMTPDQQQRRAARVEMLENLTPQERMQVRASQQRWASLPPDRQQQVRRAFHDLGAVPPEQRQMVLNSGRYQGAFTPEERGILNDLLRVEPYRHPGQ